MKRLSSRSYWGLLPILALGLVLSVALWACGGDETSLTSPRLDQANTSASRAPEFAAAIGAHNRFIPDALSTPRVVGTAIGADEHGKPVFKVYAEESIPPGRIAERFEGYRVVVQVTGPIEAHKGGPPPMDGGGSTSDPKSKQTPPVKMGTSGGWQYDLANGYCCGGTLGALIEFGGNKYILSNYHVLYADIVNGGNGRTASSGDPVIQPGLIDVSCNAGNSQSVGSLISNGGSLPNRNFDAGVALINSNVDASGAILNVGQPSAGNGVGAFVGQAVKKMGRTTGLTRSSVSGVNGAFSITYSNECAGGTSFTQNYTGQIVISNDRCKFQDGGDSGSLLLEDVDNGPNAVGLCFAGSSVCRKGSIAIANPIGEVLAWKNASIVGQ